MSTTLAQLISGIKKAVLEAQRSVAGQHIEELEQFFYQPAAGAEGTTDLPPGSWVARSVRMSIPREVSHNGVVSQVQHSIDVPLITLLPLKSFTIERVEILTSMDLSLPNSPSNTDTPQASGPSSEDILQDPDVQVSMTGASPHSAEIKIVVQGHQLPEGYSRLVQAYEKLLNAQLPA
ncbi:DUF2589 domain-containing protein [Curvibacter sp. CHRR-16]|uniref:DUF2589 domain-containing protein n=1 Tax=Curvibacter sp. CHRR-16 TaxID=2835872 RepID=UPI001BDAE290|nr:DUF2589 domain-containing protein [Curvibacter sp. CHRR-16]MBT0569627.1 DUF2589 domain-containing protein [Curvibacter sp. CHRR-16]